MGEKERVEDELTRFVNAVEGRDERLSELRDDINRLANSVSALTTAVSIRPTGAEVAFRRRRLTFMGVLFGLGIIFLHDVHVENCAPGVRAEAAAEIIASGNPEPLAEIRRVVSRDTPSYCDTTFPLHGHDPAEPDPTPRALTGWAGYLIGLGGLAAWAWRPWPWRRRRATDRDGEDGRG